MTTSEPPLTPPYQGEDFFETNFCVRRGRQAQERFFAFMGPLNLL